MSFDIDSFATKLRSQAGARSQHKCARYVRIALAAGGAPTNGTNPHDAKDWGPVLLRLGFHEVAVADDDNFIPMKGDVVVIQPFEGGNRSGHIAAYDGKNWISDFIQRDFWSGQGYRTKRPQHVFYRH